MLSLKSCSLLAPLILFGKFLSVLGKRSKTIFNVDFHPNCSMIVYIQSHPSCKHRTGCPERCSSVLASNSLSSELSSEQEMVPSEQNQILLLAGSPRTAVLHVGWALGLTKMLMSAPGCCRELREKGKRPQSFLRGGGCQCLCAQSPGITGLFILFCT